MVRYTVDKRHREIVMDPQTMLSIRFYQYSKSVSLARAADSNETSDTCRHREKYTNTQAQQVCDWLNDRESKVALTVGDPLQRRHPWQGDFCYAYGYTLQHWGYILRELTLSENQRFIVSQIIDIAGGN